MVACVSERGYAATRLDDLVELSGVSTASFYRLFASKDACFLATCEELLRNALTALAGGKVETWEARVRGSLDAFAQLVSTQPAAARMLLIDSFAAGPEAASAVDDTVGELRRRAVALVSESPERADLPDEVAEAMVGAVQELARDRLWRGRPDSLPQLMGVAAEVALSYRPPTEPLNYTGRLPRPLSEALEVPGSAERAIRALAVVAAERGYRQVTVEEVVRRASMSPTTFYAEFADKGAAMLAAIDAAGAQMAASALPHFRRNADWPAALRTALTDLLAYLASRPALAHLVFVEVYAAGPEALQRRAEALRPLSALLAPGAGRSTLPDASHEVVWAAIVAMIQQQIRDSGAHTLPALGPILTFVALGPYLGSEKAGASAFGGRRDRRGELGAIDSFYGDNQAVVLEIALSTGAMTPEELSEKLGIGIDEVRRKLTRMFEAGLIESLEGRTKDDPIGGRYRYLRENAILDDALTEVSIAERQSLASLVVANLKRELDKSFEAELVTLRPEFVMVRAPMNVDEQGWREVSGLLEKALHETIEAIEAARLRIEKSGEPPIRATAGLLLFELPEEG